MRVLVSGAAGLLGAHVMERLGRAYNVHGVDRHEWWGDRRQSILQGDLLSDEFLATVVRHTAPEVCIHCAAMADVDACEADPALANRVNAVMTGELAKAVGSDCLFVYITTDGIFAGDKPFATEEWPPQPRTAYGRSKLGGENAVSAATANHLIVRTNFYGWSSGRKRTSAEWLFAALESREPVTLFDDFFFTPMYVVDVVMRLEQLIHSGKRGIFHLGGRDRVTKYDFGLLMAELAGLSTDAVRRGSIDGARFTAPRPRDMSLRSERFIRAVGGELPSVREGLERFLVDRDRPLSRRVDRFLSSTGPHAES